MKGAGIHTGGVMKKQKHGTVLFEHLRQFASALPYSEKDTRSAAKVIADQWGEVARKLQDKK
jgi:hypothetical protein